MNEASVAVLAVTVRYLPLWAAAALPLLVHLAWLAGRVWLRARIDRWETRSRIVGLYPRPGVAPSHVRTYDHDSEGAA